MYNEHGVIRNIIRKYYSHVDVDRNDLHQAGYVGYLKAMQNFNEVYGTLSMKYATSYIRKEISKFIKNELETRSRTHPTPIDEMEIADDLREEVIDLRSLLSESDYLSDLEREVLIALCDGNSSRQIAERHLVSESRVSQIKKKAIKKIQKALDL